jgi:hypothetical protein
VVNLSSGEIIEAAIVGKDGVVDAFATLGGKIPVNRAIVQLAGPALTCKVSELRSAVLQSQSSVFRHEQAVYAQASQSAAAWQPTTMPMASSFARPARTVCSSPRNFSLRCWRQANQRDAACSHASTIRNYKIFEGLSDHGC